MDIPDDFDEPLPGDFDDMVIGARTGKQWQRRFYTSADEPLRDFQQYVDEYMEEIVRVDGRGDAASWVCPTCPAGQEGEPQYRCSGCLGLSLYCSACIVRIHAKRPFCDIEQWDGESFLRTSLFSLGLRIQLGHVDGEPCENATPVNKDFTVMDITGIHHCAIDQCGCCDAPSLRQQLLRHRLFPASAHAPRTACTFNLLEHFHHLTHHGKVTMYDFYNALEKMSDSLGISGLKDRHHVFARCIREWKYLKCMKRGGRANDCVRKPSDVRPGELAVRCPACPVPGENLPTDWQRAPKEKQYLYFLIIALDACFRLKRRQVSSIEKDPRLMDGSAYIIERTPFDRWIKTIGQQDEVTSSCSGLSALEHANTKYSKGYAETGKGIGVCARHEFVQPNGVVPLQAGERYANMDYALASLLKSHSPDLKVILSYDIACQFSKNLVERIKKLPPLLRFEVVALTMRFVVPKLHILGHQLACQLMFNIAYMFGGARTDGEGVERPWAHLGPLGTSLRQMGPGSAADTLDDHLSHWNWLKLIALGAFLLRKLLEALKEEAIQRAEFEDFSRAQAEHVPEWRDSVLKFEENNGLPNPFEMPKCGATEEEVQRDLAQEESEAATRGFSNAHDLSPVQFIVDLLAVEDQQRNLAADVAAKTFTTPKQQTDLFRQRSKLGRAVTKLKAAQKIYMPPAAMLLGAWEADAANQDVPIEQRPLYPPSILPPSERALCLGDVATVEGRLRDAQCRTALANIRDLLLAKSRDLRFKNSNIRHQGSSTRARNVISKIDDKVAVLAQKYNAARAAALLLADPSVAVSWRFLDVNRDLRLMQDADESGLRRTAAGGSDAQAAATSSSHMQRLRDATGEGRRTVSWIWYGTNTSDPNAQGTELYEGIRVEWCKAFARLRRWQEQIPLIREEMRRTPISLRRRAAEWQARKAADNRAGPLGEGARAYAARQHRVYIALAAHFEALFANAPMGPRINLAYAQRLHDELQRDETDTEAIGIAPGEESEESDGEV
ncbi:hypothetical protein HDZ31DRAFT_67576 [Schizophyllum fasciatum]